MAEYVLHIADDPLMTFSAQRRTGLGGGTLDIHIHWVDEANRNRLPFPIAPHPTAEAVREWLTRRTIPRNRQFAEQILSAAGLAVNDVLGIIDLCKGLSVNDAYWLEREGENLRFADINLFDNQLDEALALTAYTGYTSSEKHAIGLSSEWTTDGQFPKAWRRGAHGLELWKGGTEGYANAGMEPYSELFAAQVARQVGIDAVNYHLDKWKGKLASVCPLMNTADVSFVPFYAATGNPGFPLALATARAMGEETFDAVRTMYVFDALIANRDRHANNHGFLRDNATGHMLGPAPLFDHNCSLLAYAMEDEWSDPAWMDSVLDTQGPASVRESFMEQAQSIMGPQQHEMLRRALDIHLVNDERYPMDSRRLAALERYVRNAARRLLEVPPVDEAELMAQLDEYEQEATASNPAWNNERELAGK